MLKRYTLPPMQSLWGDPARKFGFWLQVDLAILLARVALGSLERSVYDKIEATAKIDVARIEEIEEEVEHDRIAFIKSIQEQLVAAGHGDVKEEFGKYVTSYDIEDPAMILMLREAVQEILRAIDDLDEALRTKAAEHKWTLMIATTHGQDAEPTTFGHLLLVYSQAVRRSRARLLRVLETELAEGKISGAVGIHGGLPEGVEKLALHVLGLKPAAAETQILQRDRHAAVLAAIAIYGGTITQIANTFWVMMRSSTRELREPRKPKQRGSSAMSHKRNPIKIEQFRGLPRLLKGALGAAIDDIGTEDFREISQSSVERHIFPDATGLAHYLTVKLTGIVRGLEVFANRMLRNLNERTGGVWATQRIRIALMEAGVGYDEAYVYTQQAAFKAVDGERHLRDLLAEMPISETDRRTAWDIIGVGAIETAFDAYTYVEPGVEIIFGRCGLAAA